MNNLINNLTAKVNENLPTVYSTIGIGVGVATIGYSVFAGIKITKALDALSEDATTMDKFKAIAPYLAPIGVGAGVMVGFGVAANKEWGGRYAAVATGLAATQLDKDKLQAKYNALMSSEEIPEDLKEAAEDTKVPAKRTKESDPWEEHWFHDVETGYIYKTTQAKFWEAVYSFNDMLGNMDKHDSGDIAMFYDDLLGRNYQSASTHEDVMFGPGCDVKSLVPKLEGEVADNMQLIYKVKYRYSKDGYSDSI